MIHKHPGYAGVMRRTVIVVALLALLPACSLVRREAVPWPTGPTIGSLTAQQKRIADQLVNIFEYSSTTARYDQVNDLGDGRGFTCGKVGFTTSSHEVVDIVAAYVDQVPDSPLDRHLPRLRALAAKGSDDTSGLDGFQADWAHAATDARFRTLQDAAADRLTFQPALDAAHRLGLRTALGVAVLYDTAVQHGTGDDPDGLDALIEQAGPVGTEKEWLVKFLAVRADDLRDPHDQDSRKVWADSVDRADALRRLVEDDHYTLRPPLTVEAYGDTYDLTG